MTRELKQRSLVLVDEFNACELKWFISRCAFFSGARMHATIAAISSGVPTAALAYSPKVKGVFETCHQTQSVVDLRELDEVEAIASIHGALVKPF